MTRVAGEDVLRLTTKQQREVLLLAGRRGDDPDRVLELVLQAGMAAMSKSEPGQEPPADPRQLLAKIAGRLGVTVDELRAKDRSRSRSAMRRAVMVELRAEGFSYPEIGRVMNLDHTSVMYAVRVANGDERALKRRKGPRP